MTLPGVPLAVHLPPPASAPAVLLLGGDARTARGLRQAGYDVARHALDMGPLAQLRGIPFTPPVVDWPFADGTYDAVILLDELALTVREEEALAEAARVLRPGGVLLLRQDLRELLSPHVRVRELRAAGLGLSDAVRLAMMLVWRWALRTERADAAIRRVPQVIASRETTWSLAGRGYWLVAAAERLST